MTDILVKSFLVGSEAFQQNVLEHLLGTPGEVPRRRRRSRSRSRSPSPPSRVQPPSHPHSQRPPHHSQGRLNGTVITQVATHAAGDENGTVITQVATQRSQVRQVVTSKEDVV